LCLYTIINFSGPPKLSFSSSATDFAVDSKITKDAFTSTLDDISEFGHIVEASFYV